MHYMEQNDLDPFKIFIELEIYFIYHLVKDVLGAPWCTRCDPH